ncbi:MAG: prenyltransferase [Tannerella sp.]|jgi:1,4-dihydroxy-2-naphthoate octaprenyltransferase|nr:prenyltransferase [Tannerella sp.]
MIVDEMKPTLKQWILAFRPWSFPASTMPALTALTFVFFQYHTGAVSGVNWMNGWLALPGVLACHAGGNLISDYYDYRYGVDRKESFGSSRLLIEGVFRPVTILWYGYLFLLAGALTGIYLMLHSGVHLLWIGVAGITGSVFYYRLKYRALGDLLIFLIYGLLIALGTAYVMTSQLNVPVLLLSMPTGFLVVNILHANNTRDILHDRQAHIRTQAMLLGLKASKVQYALLALGSYVAVVLPVIFRAVHPLCLSVLVTLPLAFKNIRQMRTAQIEHPERIRDLDGKSAQLVLAFGLLLIISNVLAAWI